MQQKPKKHSDFHQNFWEKLTAFQAATISEKAHEILEAVAEPRGGQGWPWPPLVKLRPPRWPSLRPWQKKKA
jgi:hypothetical protein